MNTNTMKAFTSAGAALLLAMGTIAGLSGCAGDRYHESTGEQIDDTAITARVKDALHKDTVYKYSDVHVTTFKGTVQLSGFVDNRDQKHQAVELARTAAGAKEVQDNITVR